MIAVLKIFLPAKPAVGEPAPAVLVVTGASGKNNLTKVAFMNATCFIGPSGLTDANGARVSSTQGVSTTEPFTVELQPGDELWAKVGDLESGQTITLFVTSD